MSFLNIPQRRLILYILFLALVPHIFLAKHFYEKKEDLDALQTEAESLENLFLRQIQKGSFNEALVKTYKGSDTRQREMLIEARMKAKFIEGKMEKKGSLQEVPVQLAAPLSLNASELKELLSLIEDKSIPPYQALPFPALCLITDISLQRVQNDDKQQMMVNLKILKREFS